ncbi:MFS transporter [Paraburkholderia sp. UYCP14C]|uniref:MFS transporter n=1 Tax=Paraburkholderia sp. UYCP14C TaxID=2511130 RepID=UPI0010201E17|nr:MFS transporter [Paraburkholderia sp. UYCP14C]RZF29191.1 MFS transporter [Paraburkholderia sp. UYCP14C]
MGDETAIDIGTVIERQQTNRFGVLLIVAMGVMMMTEGYDLAAMAFAAPALGRAWHLEHGVLGPVFGAFVFGTMIGAFVLGYLGDVIGRKRMIVIGSVVLAGFTLAASRATALDQLLVLRFLAGIGIGGVVPNAIAYTTEFAPKRWRATWVTLMYTGYTIGSSVGGLVSAWLVPKFGWQVVFVIGGIAPLVSSAMLWFAVPESIRFLTLKGRHAEVARIVARIAPGLPVAPGTRFVTGGAARGDAHGDGSLQLLFAGRLRALTPVLWAVYIANSMALFFLSSWLPVLIESVGLAPREAALVSTMFQLGGTLGGLALMRFVDTRGAIIITVLPLVGTPVVALLGTGLPGPMLVAAVFLTGFTVVGTQFGLNAVAALVYPTALRAKGTGAAVGIQKIGAIAGPVIGGMLMSAHLPVEQLFFLGAVPVAFVAVLAFALGLLHRRRDDAAPDHPHTGAAHVA